MKESLPKQNDNKMNRREFLKNLGVGAVAVGAIAAGAYKFDKFLKNDSAERKEHEKQGEAVIVKKNHEEPSNQVLMAGKISVIVPHPEEWIIILKIKELETSFSILKEDYEKYNIGDKVPVKYDDRDMRVNEILTKEKEKNKKQKIKKSPNGDFFILLG
ncbi:twin-arginine translocation signal domain-containing protein [Patescibacteria group bacterium]|nr:twin-arginine translocation signal domain-containing protein [Patescibacteria group bacterium]